MEKVITINNWWDGPQNGLAYFNGIVCIYERIFDEAKDDWSDEYYLTPVSSDLQNEILNEWREWCEAVSSDKLDEYYAAHSDNRAIEKVLEQTKDKRLYRKKGVFSGRYEAGFVPVEYTVEWFDIS